MPPSQTLFLDWGFAPGGNNILSEFRQTIALKGRLNVGITKKAQLVRYNQLLSLLVLFPYEKFIEPLIVVAALRFVQ